MTVVPVLGAEGASAHARAQHTHRVAAQELRRFRILRIGHTSSDASRVVQHAITAIPAFFADRFGLDQSQVRSAVQPNGYVVFVVPGATGMCVGVTGGFRPADAGPNPPAEAFSCGGLSDAIAGRQIAYSSTFGHEGGMLYGIAPNRDSVSVKRSDGSVVSPGTSLNLWSVNAPDGVTTQDVNLNRTIPFDRVTLTGRPSGTSVAWQQRCADERWSWVLSWWLCRRSSCCSFLLVLRWAARRHGARSSQRGRADPRVNQPRMATERARRGSGATHAASPSAGKASVRVGRAQA